MNEAEAIVSDHLVTGWTPNLVQRVIVLVRDDRDSLPRFVGAALRDAPDGVTLFDEALSFLSEEELAVAIELALQVLCERATSEAAESVIAHAAFHAPHLLTKHLRTCWELLDEYQAWTWRAADAGEVTRLLAIASTESEHAERAWRCLIETRDRDIVVRAANALSRAGSDPLRGGNPSYDGWLNHVGFTDEGGGVRELYSPTAFHLQFPAGFLDEHSRKPWNSTTFHPTWRTDPNGASTAVTFGGLASGTCPFCNGPLHRLFKWEQAPADMPVPSPLDVAVCLPCLGWEQTILFYKHDAEGAPTGLNPEGKVSKPEFLHGPLRPTPARLVRFPERWAVQDWGMSNGHENLNRVGGAPSWVQSAEYPTCVGCARKMPFLAQLDSDLPLADGGEWQWGSGGMGYVFWCTACRISALLWQCT